VVVKRGADFAELAREKSTDATSVDGGFLGQVDPAINCDRILAAASTTMMRTATWKA
jgi:hypothetical protein